MPTEEEYQDLIVTEVGDDTAGTLAANVELLWSRFTSVDDLDLHYLLAKRAAIDLMLGRARSQVTFRTSSGSGVSLSDLFDHLKQLRESVEIEIGAASGSAVGAGGLIGELTQTAPILRDTRGGPDPNSRAIRGDSLKRQP